MADNLQILKQITDNYDEFNNRDSFSLDKYKIRRIVNDLLILFFPEFFAGMFTPDPELLAFASRVLPIYCGAIVIFGIQTACQLTFVAIGFAGSSILVAVVRKFVLLLPLIYLMPRLVEDQTLGVYMAEPAADVLAVLFTVILFSIRFRKALGGMSDPKKGSV